MKYDVWEKVEIARSSERPNAADYIEKITKDFFELHGDRNFCDDKAIIGGIATFGGIPVTVIGHMKGKTTKRIYQETLECYPKYKKGTKAYEAG